MKKTWFVGFRYTNPSTGERKQFQFRGDINIHKTKRERIAEGNALCDTITTMLQNGWNPFTDETQKEQDFKPVYDLLDELLQIKRNTLKIKSYSTYTDVKNILQRWLKRKNYKTLMPVSFTSKLAREYADYLLSERQYSGKTFNHMIGILKTFFNMMVERELISDNPFKRIKKVPQDIGKNHAFTREEKTALIKLLKERNRWLYYFVVFMYHGFIRRNELIQLKISDINLAADTITIRSEISKNRKQESISITEGLRIIINEMDLTVFPGEWYIFGRGLKPGPIGYAKGDVITGIHREFLKQLEIPPEKTLYSWKHTGVCDYFNLIKDPYALMRQLRHHDLSMTMIYLKSMGLAPNDQIINARLLL